MLRSRLPDIKYIVPVYGLIVLLLYGWTLYTFSWNLPAWILFRTAGDVAVTFCYGMAVDFIESIIFLSFLLLIAVLFPSSWIRDEFVLVGSILSLSILGGIMYLITTGKLYQPTTLYPLVLTPAFLARILNSKIPLLKKIMDGLADRCVIFVYLSLPISAASIIVVIARNLI